MGQGQVCSGSLVLNIFSKDVMGIYLNKSKKALAHRDEL